MMKNKIRKNVNDTPMKTKEDVVLLLNHLLSEFLDLALMTKQAHWNMRGKNFIAIHEMLDPFNAKLLDYADTIAERIAQLGGTAYGTSQLVAQNSSLAEYPTDISSTDEQLSALLERYATLANAVRKVVEDGMTDEGTANFLTDASNDLDKYLWFIESNLATA